MSIPGERRLVHQRQVTCLGFERSDGWWDIEGTLIDRKPFAIELGERGRLAAEEAIHEMTLRIAIDHSLLIHEVEACIHNSPYRVCPAIAGAYQRLVGLRIGPGFSQAVKRMFRGIEGCTHLTELIGPMATTAYQTLWDRVGVNDESLNTRRPIPNYAVDGCHALRADGELVRLLVSDHPDKSY